MWDVFTKFEITQKEKWLTVVFCCIWQLRNNSDIREYKSISVEWYVWLGAWHITWSSPNICHDCNTGSRTEPWATPQISRPQRDSRCPVEAANHVLGRHEMKGHLCQTQSALRGISCCQKAAESKRLGAQLCWKQDLNRKKKKCSRARFLFKRSSFKYRS